MRKLEVTVSGADIKLTELGKLTSGMVGAKVLFSFTPEWDGLLKIAVFKGNDILRGVPLTAEEVKIPPECLAESGTLWVGAYGFLNDGTIAIPTVRSGDIVIWPGAAPSGETAVDPTPPLWVQLMTMMGDPIQLTTKDRSTLVAAINEIAGYKGMELDDDQINEVIAYYFAKHPPTIGDMTMTGDLDMGTHRVKNVADPEEDGDAVSKKYVDGGFRPSTWTPSAADVGAAPAGYGLGASPKKAADCDDASINGWYYIDSATANRPEHIQYGVLFPQYRTSQGMVQECADVYGLVARRYKQNGVWQPWEYQNPPMVLGVEYRTTRRSNGKVVYAKKVNLGKVVHQGEYSTGVSGDLVEWVATLPGVGLSVPYNGINTDYYSTTSVYVGLSTTSGIWRTHWVIGTSYSGKYTAHIELWYTKD